MKYINNKPIRLIELFAGIGSQAKALKNIGVDFEHWVVCEFDKYAINSYNAIHNTNFATSDITNLSASDLNIVDTDTFTYLLTYSFPCQDLSNAGKGAGMEKGSGTRSGLLWEVERLINESTELPQILLMENVPQVHSKKNKEDFQKWISFLKSKGYSNFWQDLNAKNYGIPQNRNRCFMVSILGDYSFEFPKQLPLVLKIDALLESDVDEKFYLSERAIQGSINSNYVCRKIDRRIAKDGIIPTLCARDYKEPKLVVLSDDEMYIENISKDFEFVKKKSKELLTEKGYLPEKYNAYNKAEIKDISPTITTHHSSSSSTGQVCIKSKNHRIRYITPKESWRLMGFNDIDFEKAEKVCSNTQLYKQAGNSIVVNVLMAIFKELFVNKQSMSEWLDELLGVV